MRVAEDEEKLNDMSLSCEGKAKNEPAILSPGLSSGPLGAGPKFGAEGVNINRMLALSEKSRTVNAKPIAQVGGPQIRIQCIPKRRELGVCVSDNIVHSLGY